MTNVLPMPELGSIKFGELLALSSLRPDRHYNRLSGVAEELIRSIASVMEEPVSRAIDKRTAEEFIQLRKEIFSDYFDAVRALSDIARIVVPKPTLEVLVAESLSEMEADFRDHGLTAFGAAVRDQAIFTVWTIRRISNLCPRIMERSLDAGLKEADAEMSRSFAVSAVWCRFHLDCLLKSMHQQRPIYPEVLGSVLDGLRTAVNAYTWAARGLKLRIPGTEPDIASVGWDEEDRQLLEEATSDMLSEPA